MYFFFFHISPCIAPIPPLSTLSCFCFFYFYKFCSLLAPLSPLSSWIHVDRALSSSYFSFFLYHIVTPSLPLIFQSIPPLSSSYISVTPSSFVHCSFSTNIYPWMLYLPLLTHTNVLDFHPLPCCAHVPKWSFTQLLFSVFVTREAWFPSPPPHLSSPSSLPSLSGRRLGYDNNDGSDGFSIRLPLPLRGKGICDGKTSVSFPLRRLGEGKRCDVGRLKGRWLVRW